MVIEVEAALVRDTSTVGDDSRPGDRESVRPKAQLGHDRHVFAGAPIVVRGKVAGAAVRDAARRVREPVPDGLALAVAPPGTLDLVRRGGRAPCERRRKRASGRYLAPHAWSTGAAGMPK